MRVQELYTQLEKDFITPALSDDWAQYMTEISDFLAPQFVERSMGVVCDFATEITRVYTAVFPTAAVMRTILADGAHDALLFVHHPSIWDLRRAPQVFSQMDRDLLVAFKKQRIAIYNLHVPLDHESPYSTSITLAHALAIVPTQSFCMYHGGMAGVFGTASDTSLAQIHERFATAVGHKVSLYANGLSDIPGGVVAVVAGGGLEQAVLEDMVAHDVRVLVTGITAQTPYAAPMHAYAAQNGIALLGGTHYSTEKFACMAMVDYFMAHNIPSIFLAGEPLMEDL